MGIVQVQLCSYSYVSPVTYQNLQNGEDGSTEPKSNVEFTSPDLMPTADVHEPVGVTNGKKSGLPGLLSSPESLLIGLLLGLGIAFAGPRVVALISQLGAPAGTESEEPIASASVTTAQPETQAIKQVITTSGTVEAFDLLSVSPRVSGLQIQSVAVREGDRVTTGQVLAILDDSVLQSQIDQAEAQVNAAVAGVAQAEAQAEQARASLAEAQENFDRYSELYTQGAISSEELTRRRTEVTSAQQGVGSAIAAIESAKATVRSRQADINRLETQLNQTLVLAPSNGVIAEKTATVGDTASTGTPLFTIIEGDQLELAVKIPQSQMAQVNVGTSVQITSDSDPNLQLQGSVRSIDPTIDPQTRQATVKVSLPGSDRLRTGMFLNAAITTGSRQGIVIPAEALLPQSNGGFVVYTVTTATGEDGQLVDTAKANRVEVGDRIAAAGNTPAKVAITSGLTTDDLIVVSGASYLQDGDTVNVVPSDSGFVSEEGN